MMRFMILYPNEPGKKFDMKYYIEKHIPLVKSLLGTYGLVRTEVDKGIAGFGGAPAPFVCVGILYFESLEGLAKGFEARAADLMADIPNYTDTSPQIQISEIVGG
jgi:uncharacterized protein (TIGR02118 family)